MKTKDGSNEEVVGRYISQMLGTEQVFEDFEEFDSKKSKLKESQVRYLQAYMSSGGITKTALRLSMVDRETLDRWKADDPVFQKALRAAELHWVEELRRTAFIRAQAKSDVLLMFLLKSLQPEVFDEDIRKQQYVGLSNQKDAIPVRATLVRDNTINFNLSTEAAEEIREIILKKE